MEQRCSLTTASLFLIGTDTAEQVVNAVLTKLPALKRMAYYVRSYKAGSSFHMGPFCSLLPCPHLTHVYIRIAELYQGHLELLAHLQHLQVLVVKGQESGYSESPPGGFPGPLATVQTLRTLHITQMFNGLNTVDDAISKLSNLEELHFVNCQIRCVSSGLLRLSQLQTLQISNTVLDDKLELPELGQLPKLTKLAIQCGIYVLPAQLRNCTQLTSFCFKGHPDFSELPIGPYLKDLKEIAMDSHLARASVLKEATKLQRLFCMGTCHDGYPLSTLQTDLDLRTFALSVPNLQEMHVSLSAIAEPQAIQMCILLNQLLTEKRNGPQGRTVLQVRALGSSVNQLPPWITKAEQYIW